MPNKQKQKPLYINLYDPEVTRKDLLKAAIHSVELLEKFEYSKEIRSLKKEKLKLASEMIKDVHEEVNALKRSLPHDLIRRKDEKVIKDIKVRKQKSEDMPKPKKTHNQELKRLEDELYEIKNKLSGLEI